MLKRNFWLWIKKKTVFFYINIWERWRCISLCFYSRICLLWGMYLRAVFVWWSEKLNFKQKLSARVNQKVIKSSWKECFTWMCFKFWPIKNIFRKRPVNKDLNMLYLQNYRELLWLATFSRVYSNSKGRYPTSLHKISILTWKLLVVSNQNISCELYFARTYFL